MATKGERAGNMEEYLFSIVRPVTITVKLFPFLYAIGLLLFWLIAPTFSYEVISAIDSLIFLSAVMVLFLIRLSYCVHLCIWHRLQCALPLLPQIVAQVDEHFYELGLYASIVNYAMMAAIFTLSLINAYFVFIKPAVRK
ncbi:MAG: hypothetical protein HDS68_02550 [Bacteroidales bacterium]|nr:hypothetical protein [Bacteroidales bacterium]